MSARDIRAVVVMRFDEAGELTVHIADPAGSVVVLTVDHRCPDDLVYEHLCRDEPADVVALAPRPWGNIADERHQQAAARVLHARDGLRLVSPPQGEGQ